MTNPHFIKYHITPSVLICPIQKLERRAAEKCFLDFAQLCRTTLLGQDWCGAWIVLADSWPPKKP